MLGIPWLARGFPLHDTPALLAEIGDRSTLPVLLIDRQTMASGIASHWRRERALQSLDAAHRDGTGGKGAALLGGKANEVLPALTEWLRVGRLHRSGCHSLEIRAPQDRMRAARRPLGAGSIPHSEHLLVHHGAVRSENGRGYRVNSPIARAVQRLCPDRPAPEAHHASRPRRSRSTGSTSANSIWRRIRVAAAPRPTNLPHLRARIPHSPGWKALLIELLPDREGRDRPDLGATSGRSGHLMAGEISPSTNWARAALRAEISPERAAGIGNFLSEVTSRAYSRYLLIGFTDIPVACWRPNGEDSQWHTDGPDLIRRQRPQAGTSRVGTGLRQICLTGRLDNRLRMAVAS